MHFISRNLLAAGVLLLAAVGVTSSARAQTIYIGDDPAETTTITASGGTQADSLNPLTYAFTAPVNRYTAATNQTIKITEVNFLSDEGGGLLTPYIALYNGGDNQSGNSYSVISIGDAITPPAGAFGGSPPGFTLVNTQYLVGGVNPTISLTAGQTIVAGFQQTSRIVVVGGAGASGTADYITQSTALPGTTPNPLTANGQYAFDRTMAFNVGITVVPEPASAAMLGLAGVGLLTRRRRAR